jgi:hypothetical protein
MVPDQPAQQTATFGGPASPDGQGGIHNQEAKPFRPLYQPGQAAGGAIPANYVAPAASARLCDMSLTLGRVGDDVVLTGDLLHGIDELMARMSAHIPPEKRAEQRAALVKEITDGITDYAAHVAAGAADPAKEMSDSHRIFLCNMVKQLLEVKMIYQDFRKEVPKEGQEEIKERVDRYFDDSQVKALMKRENVTTPSDLENALHAKGSSLDREKRSFTEQFIAQQWIMQKVKPENAQEITHEDMIEWYHAHIKDFEQPARVRWEELMVSFSKHANHDEARFVLANMGNRVIAGASLDEVAKSDSDGVTAKQGGRWDWTRKGSLDSNAIEDAIFNLPVDRLSPILESSNGLHIVRVIERQESTATSFLLAQKTVKEQIDKERLEKKQQEFVKELQGKFPIWTVFDASMQHDAEEEDRYLGR